MELPPGGRLRSRPNAFFSFSLPFFVLSSLAGPGARPIRPRARAPLRGNGVPAPGCPGRCGWDESVFPRKGACDGGIRNVRAEVVDRRGVRGVIGVHGAGRVHVDALPARGARDKHAPRPLPRPPGAAGIHPAARAGRLGSPSRRPSSGRSPFMAPRRRPSVVGELYPDLPGGPSWPPGRFP